jgi:(p)ppGpp synthase/HD superfamily hydrolase
VAACLHDAIEDAGAQLEEIEQRFGARVARLVKAVTEDAAIDGWAERKAALRGQVAAADDDAVLLFTADKLCKARELRIGGTRPPHKLEHYARTLELAEDRLGDHPLVRLLRFELEALDRLPPQPAGAAVSASNASSSA